MSWFRICKESHCKSSYSVGPAGQCQNKTEGLETGGEGAADTHPSDIVEFQLQYSFQRLGVTVTHSSYF